MITELGKNCCCPVLQCCNCCCCLHISFLLICLSLRKRLGSFPWHHFEHILPLVLVEIACLVLAPPYLQAKFLPFIFLRITMALIPQKSLWLFSQHLQLDQTLRPVLFFHLSPVNMTGVLLLCPPRKEWFSDVIFCHYSSDSCMHFLRSSLKKTGAVRAFEQA